MKEIKHAQDLITTTNSSVRAGFNQFINGCDAPSRNNYGDVGDWYDELRGYGFAEKMARENGIAFKHKFRCKCGALTDNEWVYDQCDNNRYSSIRERTLTF